MIHIVRHWCSFGEWLLDPSASTTVQIDKPLRSRVELSLVEIGGGGVTGVPGSISGGSVRALVWIE